MAEILAVIDDSVEATLDGGESWQRALRQAIRSGRELCARLEIPFETACPSAESDFSVFAPLEYVDRMQPGNADDPLLRQVLASRLEIAAELSGQLDAVGDLQAARGPGLLQKYDHRVLMITTGACAVHCRYCFRRHYPYQTVPIGQAGWQPALDAIAADESLDEVILSGGDPLTLADRSLAWLCEQIADIPHIQRIRLHTRVPVVLPQRVCPALLDWVNRSKIPIFFVLHFNHAAELDARTHAALRQLRQAGATLLNQAVMLRGVNDSFALQRDLCLALVNQQVLPYYVHQLDPVQGAMHFAVPDAQAVQIMSELCAHLPGYADPKLAREEAGAPSKTWVR